MPYTIAKNGPDDKPYCVYKKGEDGGPTGESLGCHPSEEDAQRQIAAIHANEGAKAEGLTISAHDMESICPDCAAKMKAQNIASITLKALKAMPEQLLRGLCDKMGADPGLFTRCMGQSFGAFDPAEKERFCAWLHHECLGEWPGEHRGKAAGMSIKTAAEFELDVLGVPFGSEADRDSDGQWFDAQTRFHEDKFPLPPSVYYHGFGPDRRPLGAPEYIGKAVRRWVDQAGVWYRVVLDKASEYARRVWEAAKAGRARASSGSAMHLVRVDPNGHIREWPVVELSIFDAEGDRQPAHRYAVALPAAKMMYERAGLTLPEEIRATPGAAAQGTQVRADAGKQQSNARGAIDVDEKELQRMVAEAVAQAVPAALRAQRDAEEAAARAAKERQDAIDAAVKAEAAKWEAKLAELRRLPGGGAGPAVLKFDRRFDHLTVSEHALMVGILATKMAKAPASLACLQALAAKMAAQAAKGEACSVEGWDELQYAAIKAGKPIKADEIIHTDLTSYGAEWVGTLYSRDIWDKIRAGTWVLQQLAPYEIVIPDGYPSDVFPLESDDPTWYKVPEASDTTSGRPDVTVPSSQHKTGQKSVAVAKLGCRAIYSGEMTEDSLVPYVPQLMRQMQASGAEQLEHAIIDGDTETSATTNINNIGGTPTSTDLYLLINGFRKLALVTNTDNSRSAGALSEDDYLETLKLLGTVGQNALADLTKCHFIPDANTYWASLKLSSLKTKDVWANATLENGELTRIWGVRLRTSAYMHYKSANRKANTSGKVDQTTTSNNTTGAILAVRWDQWRLAWKRRMTVESDRWPESDANQIVALARVGLAYRDAEAAAISYGVTGV